MQITRAETVRLRIPFSDPGKGEGLFPGTWNALDFVLLRIETDAGLVGWGEGFSYFCAEAVEAITRQSVAPLLIGRDPRDPEPILAELKQKLHIMGRYGITMFAISAASSSCAFCALNCCHNAASLRMLVLNAFCVTCAVAFWSIPSNTYSVPLGLVAVL